MAMIRTFAERGYRKLITTPHIIQDFYNNSTQTIMPALKLVQKAIKAESIPIELSAAAEYFLDEAFIDRIDNNEPLLTFGDNYVLFETPFLNEPVYLRDVIFKLILAGYKPVFAHPERYQYLFGKMQRLEEIYDSGALLQINLLSLLGYYNKPSQDIAEWLIDKQMVAFAGTDCHKPKHQEAMLALAKNKHYNKLLTQPLLNHRL